MRKTTIGILSILACTASPVFADGFSESDRALIAGKGVFPTDDGSEATLPEADMTDDTTTDPNSGDGSGSQNGSTPSSGGKSEKEYTPEVKSNGPSGAKDVFPESKTTTPKAK